MNKHTLNLRRMVCTAENYKVAKEASSEIERLEVELGDAKHEIGVLRTELAVKKIGCESCKHAAISSECIWCQKLMWPVKIAGFYCNQHEM